MSNESSENYFQAVTAGKLQFGLQQATQRIGDFFELLKKAEGHLKSQGMTIVWPDDSSISTGVSIRGPLGEIEVTSILILDDEYVGAALNFVDRFAATPELPFRKLYAAILKSSGDWVGSDGKGLNVEEGRLTPASVMKAVLSAVAAQLKGNTDYVRGFAGA